ncbi:MAG: hypothetical protein HQK51_02250 [Oligoflexia bacterium]|nr:hypothetical protein [Oligoflexia bacterium]
MKTSGILTLIILFFLPFLVTNCGNKSEDILVTNNSIFFNKEVKEIMPLQTDSTVRDISEPQLLKKGEVKNWNHPDNWESVIYNIWSLLRDDTKITYPADWNEKNIYSLLKEVEISDSITCLWNYRLNKTLTPPFTAFNQFNSGIKYSRARTVSSTDMSIDRSFDINVVWAPGSIFYALMTKKITFLITNANLEKQYVIESKFDRVNGDLKLNLALNQKMGASDENGNSIYLLTRFELQGNTTTHSFTLNYVRRSYPTGHSISLLGKGVSKGNSVYYLFKAKSNMSPTTTTYYCIKAGLPLSTFQSSFEANNPDGATYGTDIIVTTDLSTISSTNCASYLEYVQNTNFFDYTSETDVPYETTSYPVTAFW